MNNLPTTHRKNFKATNRENRFSSLFDEEETTPSTSSDKKEILIPPIIKSLDSIILNLSEAVKTAVYWDDYIRKNEINIVEMLSKKSSVMLNVVDYLVELASHQSIQNHKPEEKSPPEKRTNGQLVSFYQCTEKKQSCEVIKIFTNLVKTFSTVSKALLVKMEFPNFEKRILEILNFLPYEKIVVRGDNFQTSSLNLLIEPNDSEKILEEKYSACSEELICDEIIENLKHDNKVKHAISLLDDLVKESEKNIKKRPLTPRKIKESLHKLENVFCLWNKETNVSLVNSENYEAKEKKFYSDMLKLLESLTEIVKIQFLQDELIRQKSSFYNYESAVSIVSAGIDSPENLEREINETLEMLANYSEKAKRLIRDFRMKNKRKESKKVAPRNYSKRYNHESCESYFKRI